MNMWQDSCEACATISLSAAKGDSKVSIGCTFAAGEVVPNSKMETS